MEQAALYAGQVGPLAIVADAVAVGTQSDHLAVDDGGGPQDGRPAAGNTSTQEAARQWIAAPEPFSAGVGGD